MNRFNISYIGTGFRGYPIGTVAYYGPDDKTAVKAVAAIIRNEGEKASVIRKWVSTDIIRNKEVQKEISAFLKANKAKSIIITESAIGCVHEEGIDFPVGEDCPFCPFWKGKQRAKRH
jgi:hypothetical protein